ncbi:PREDICTED: uncharacterized protein LOC109338012 isoform X1 [Lupinus angustifolius]|uniref:uncharacterized protein LOC109338012 isoform X1 n=1 Tax=Lupinus angustifolius TaxID=3871 RepID=UPI00092ED6F7|nr:PREDICTED: uncharacterized protein LOC109338012 isoform X1 [Lupinus angustifolius]XP_019430678.1 PREDICTED: uncharacterized protein LOC109338012 isoform X1 [Lupinus angustifolius]
MEHLGGNWFDGLSNSVKRRRSQMSRRPRRDSLPAFEGRGLNPLFSTPSSEDASQISRHKNASNAINFNTRHRVSHASGNVDMYGGRNSEGPRQSGDSKDGVGNENKVKKLKLKVGGMTCTIHANPAGNTAPENGLPKKSSQSSDGAKPQEKKQSYSNSNHSSDKRSGLQRHPWKDLSRSGFGLEKEESLMGRISGKNIDGNRGDKSEAVRKSKRVPKRRVIGEEFADDDDEIQYLEKLKTTKVSAEYRDEQDFSTKHRKLSSVSNMENGASSTSHKVGNRRSSSDRVSEDKDNEDEDAGFDAELQDKKRKKQRNESDDISMDSKREMTLTTRQRVLQSSKDASGSSASFIEFPNGLPPLPSRKQKEKLSETEQQLKKAEAAQKRRMQNEKAARESEAEAIRKILGQDSSRKKREDKVKKRQEELAQEKAANAHMLPPNTIRTVIGPNGTTVTFSEDIGIPSILRSPPISYPPPREKCAAPSCTNPYKYRHSKLKLPICSLQCHKAVEKMTADGTRVQEKMVTDETRVQEKIAADETRIQEKMVADETRIQEKIADDGTSVPEKMAADGSSAPEKMAADGTSAPEKMVADGTSVPEKMVADGTSALEKMVADGTSAPEKMAADGTRVQEKTADDETSVQEKMAADETHVPQKMVANETKAQEKATDETSFPEKMLTGETCVPEKMAADETSVQMMMVTDEASV